MEHLNESFLGVEEGITNAIKKLGLHAMGIDEVAVRHEALDELAAALQCLKTGEQEVREVLQEADITTSDAQAKTADSNARHGVAASNTPPPHGSIPYRTENLPNTEAAEKQPEPPSKGDEPAKPAEPYKTFATLEELTRFVEKMTNTVRVIAHEEACRKGREDMEQFKEEQALKRKLLAPGEIYAELNFLEEAHEAVCEILECVPDLESELAGQVNEAATRAFSRLSMVLRWGAREREDIDASDNERADGAQAENSHERTQHAAAQEGGAS